MLGRRHKCLHCLGSHGSIECLSFLSRIVAGDYRKVEAFKAFTAYDYPKLKSLAHYRSHEVTVTVDGSRKRSHPEVPSVQEEKEAHLKRIKATVSSTGQNRRVVQE
jgi:hypothetical protein